MSHSENYAWYQRRPIAMQVVFGNTASRVETLEGPVKCEAGDAIVTGVQGERWPVQRQRFEATYEVAEECIAMFQDGLYRRKDTLVQAKQLDAPMRLELSDARGTLFALAGDWLLRGPEGDHWIVADLIFQLTYELKAQR